MQLSADDLVQPISEDLPCGEDLEYDPAFQQMETMMEATDEQEFGDTVIEGSGPDWKGVSEQVDELLQRTRDMRVLTYGALADLHLTGLGAFRDSLQALNDCMETYWENIYPLLDADDDFDPMMRLNILQILNDHDLCCVGMENAPLVEIKGLGAFSLRDIELAEGKTSPVGDEEVPDIALIQGAFGDTDEDELTALGEGVGGSIEQLNRATELWSQLAADSSQLDVDETLKVLNNIHQAITNYAPVAAAAIDGEGFEDQAGSGSAAPLSGAISNRNDVVNAIEKICAYYSANEPSSPIPMLLRRAQRLVPKTFFEIIEDIASDGVDQVRMIGGIEEEEDY